MSKAMENSLFNLKFTAKTLKKSSDKAEKAALEQKKKVKQAIEKGNMEGAKIYAANAIREKNQALNYLRLSSRLDGVASRVETAIRMNGITKSMQGVVNGMDKVRTCQMFNQCYFLIHLSSTLMYVLTIFIL